MLTRALGQAARGLAFLLGAVVTAHAGSFAVSPVRATLSAAQPVSSLVVRNNGTDPTVVHVQVVSWSQEDGKDLYSPTKEILATPPIFTIPPGGSQMVRVGLRRSADGQRELAYRLFLQEVPPAEPVGQGLRVVLRVGVPVFVMPPIAAAPQLRWQAARTAQGAVKVRLTNNGNAHVQLIKSKLTVPSTGQPLAADEPATYVLPSQSKEWVYKLNPLPASGSALRVAVQTDAGDMQADLVVE